MNFLKFNQGDIVFVTFPYSDYSNGERRPVLIVSSDSYNNSSNDIITAKVTSQTKGRPYDVELKQADMKIGRLKKDSCIKTDSLLVVEKKLLNNSSIKVRNSIVEQVKCHLKTLFSIN